MSRNLLIDKLREVYTLSKKEELEKEEIKHLLGLFSEYPITESLAKDDIVSLFITLANQYLEDCPVDSLHYVEDQAKLMFEECDE